MTPLSLASRIVRAFRHRRAVQSLTELDDHTLADIGLLRTDVHAALARLYFADPSTVLKEACCSWRTFAARFRTSPEPMTCC
jgi:uncharacterized protein YjiS (DUF1127 family)